MVILLALSALLAAPSAPEPAGPRKSDAWEISLGAGASVAPKYQGSSSFRILPIPVLDVKYADRFFISPLGGAGANLIASPALHLGVAFAPNFGRAEGSDARLSGWGTRLLGDAANSPVVQQKTQFATGTIIAIHWR